MSTVSDSETRPNSPTNSVIKRAAIVYSRSTQMTVAEALLDQGCPFHIAKSPTYQMRVRREKKKSKLFAEMKSQLMQKDADLGTIFAPFDVSMNLEDPSSGECFYPFPKRIYACRYTKCTNGYGVIVGKCPTSTSLNIYEFKCLNCKQYWKACRKCFKRFCNSRYNEIDYHECNTRTWYRFSDGQEHDEKDEEEKEEKEEEASDNDVESEANILREKRPISCVRIKVGTNEIMEINLESSSATTDSDEDDTYIDEAVEKLSQETMPETNSQALNTASNENSTVAPPKKKRRKYTKRKRATTIRKSSRPTQRTKVLNISEISVASCSQNSNSENYSQKEKEKENENAKGRDKDKQKQKQKQKKKEKEKQEKEKEKEKEDDSLKTKGKDFWNLCLQMPRKHRVLKTFYKGNGDYVFYLTKNGPLERVGKGQRRVHYATSLDDLGYMVERYGNDVSIWPDLGVSDTNVSTNNTRPTITPGDGHGIDTSTAIVAVTEQQSSKRKMRSIGARLHDLEMQLYGKIETGICQIDRIQRLEDVVFGHRDDRVSLIERLEKLDNMISGEA